MRWALAIFLLLLSTPAAAELPARTRVLLDYTARDPGCPREEFLKDVIRGRTSYDPFAKTEGARLAVTVRREGRMYKGRAEVRSEAGALLYTRERGPGADCQMIVEGLGFAISVGLDPSGRAGDEVPPAAPPIVPEPPVKQVVAPALPAPEPPALPPLEQKAPFRVRIGGSVALGFGVAPRPAAGLVIDVGLRWPTFSLALEGRAYPPAEGAADTGLVQLLTWQITGAVVPCGHWRVFFGCGVVEMGALAGTGATQISETTMLFRAAGGGRAGMEWQAWEHLALRASGDLLFAPRRAALSIDYKPVWTTSIVSGALEAGFVAYF